MNKSEKLSLIKRNLQEIIGEDELDKKINSEKKFSLYWGTMPTGSLSIAYFFPMLKISDFLKAGIEVKILIADLHAALDSVPWEILKKREAYYKEAITSILKTIGVDTKKLKFVKGSNIQLNKKYFHDLLKLSTLTSLKDATKAASEVVKKIETDPKISGLIYPEMQALDEEYLKVDAQFGGMDQRKIMVYARTVLPKIGYNPRIELINPIIRGLVGEKMSSSNESTKIDILDSPETVQRKIRNAEFIEGTTDNGIMALLKYFIFVVKEDNKKPLIIDRPEKFGGPIRYNSYAELEKDVKAEKIHPLDIKNSLANEINQILKQVQTPKLKNLHAQAYV